MQKKWHSELWKPKKMDIKVPTTCYGPTETKSFYHYQDPEKGYEVRGVRPTYRKIKDSEHGYY